MASVIRPSASRPRTPAETPLYGEPGSAVTTVWPVSRLTVLFSAATNMAAALAALAASGKVLPPHETFSVPEQDWVRATQAQFQPIRVAERLWIVPSWHEPPDPHAVERREHRGRHLRGRVRAHDVLDRRTGVDARRRAVAIGAVLHHAFVNIVDKLREVVCELADQFLCGLVVFLAIGPRAARIEQAGAEHRPDVEVHDLEPQEFLEEVQAVAKGLIAAGVALWTVMTAATGAAATAGGSAGSGVRWVHQ